MTTKTFHVRTLLTVTTGRLLTKAEGPHDNGIGQMYDLLGWMTNDSPFTHQLGRFADECKPWLLRWFPELGNVSKTVSDRVMEWLAADKENGVERWTEEVLGMFPAIKERYDVPRIPQDDHVKKDPVAELTDMVGADRVVVVQSREAREES